MTVLVTSSICSIAQTSVAIAPNKMNVLYIGVDNPVSIAAYGTTDDKVSVSINGGGGAVSRVSAGNYVVRVNQITDDCTIEVNADGKLVGSSKFRVRSLPAPMATVGGHMSGENVPADAFKAQSGVAAWIKDFPFELRYQIVGYTFTVEDDKGGIKETNNEEAAFSSETKEYIAQYVKPGKTLTIDNIRASGPDGKVRKLPSLVYYIK